jgi:hypothetical protein
MVKLRPSLFLTGILVALSAVALNGQTQSARFDLTGPKIEVRVTRDSKTLPIAYVPNLQAGDKLWLHPDLPPTQSVHYLLIVAFLRGTTNPPPDEWFVRIATWNRKVQEEGTFVTVPAEAQQAILFLAPETGGDFSTLRKAVEGRPGIFVRASQDLSEAGFEQARIEKYLASMRQVPPSDPKALMEHSLLLSRTLNLKPNDECFKRSVDLQYNCLTQSGNHTLLDDGHAQNVIAALSSGSNSDFITAASYTGAAGGGSYSAYVGAAVDLFRILGGLHTAQYQYIPAISFPDEASLNLRLNTAPSFRNPKSVIVIGLPAIQKAVPPPLRPSNPNIVACLLKPNVVLPIEGAPLVFSTNFAHDLVLHLNTTGASGQVAAKDIPLTADAFQGGLVVNHTPERKVLPVPTEAELSKPASSDAPKPDEPKPVVATTPAPTIPGTITGTITGMWGFDSFTGPTVPLQSQPGSNWRLAADEPLIAGRENHVLLASSGEACVDSIRLETMPGTFTPVHWKPTVAPARPNLLDVILPLKSSDPGALKIAIRQYGEEPPAMVTAKTFAEPATLTALQFYAGDTYATAVGTNLSQVQQMTLANLVFTPALSNSDTPAVPGTLSLTLPGTTQAPKIKEGDKLSASLVLKDGRTIVLPVTVGASRPDVSLLSRNMGRMNDSALQLGSDNDLPTNQRITFSLKSTASFPRNGKIEIASLDDSLHTELTVAAGTLVLQDRHTLLGTLDPLKTFGTSAFGPLHLRAISPEGISGSWIPLATLVRLPTFTNLKCTADVTAACTLSGTDLYLVDSIASDAAFTNPTPVPEGFVGSSLPLPRPASLPLSLSATRPVNATIYLRLRDDAAATNSVTIPVLAIPAPAAAVVSTTAGVPSSGQASKR